ncbi:hypothetical protein C5167_026178 [Papaver somniferum]|nr:hypothetical protein C5167_026178 [Papaver somniferum]
MKFYREMQMVLLVQSRLKANEEWQRLKSSGTDCREGWHLGSVAEVQVDLSYALQSSRAEIGPRMEVMKLGTELRSRKICCCSCDKSAAGHDLELEMQLLVGPVAIAINKETEMAVKAVVVIHEVVQRDADGPAGAVSLSCCDSMVEPRRYEVAVRPWKTASMSW